ncbi:MAG: hypothetical protein SF069_11655 [Phycisphaerae bacterium]|nr:hypothetical protein [Phycisphaerae bacterium]
MPYYVNVCYHEQGNCRLLSATLQRKFVLVDFDTGELRLSARLSRPGDNTCDVDWEAKKFIYSSDGWRAVELCDARNGDLIKQIKMRDPARLMLGKECRFAVASDLEKPGYIIECTTGRLESISDLGSISGGALAPDRSILVVGNRKRVGFAKRICLERGEYYELRLPRPRRAVQMRFRPNFEGISVLYDDWVVACYRTLAFSDELWKYSCSGELEPWFSSWTGDGRYFVLGNDKAPALVLDGDTGRVMKSIDVRFRPFYASAGSTVMNGCIEILDLEREAIDSRRNQIDWWKKSKFLEYS